MTAIAARDDRAQGPAAPTPPPGAPAGELEHRQIMTILGGLLMGMFLAALDQTIVSTAIRSIADELHGLDMQAWVTTAYLITSTIATPLYGKLGDLFGRKKLFLFAITVFVIGSLACSFADTMTQLSVYRAVQGIGAGGLFSLALAIIGDIVPPRERAKYQGYFLAVFGTSSVLGPVLGGFFAGHDELFGLSGWRWVFLVNVPLGLLALLVVSRTLHLTHHRRESRVDWAGATALVVGLVPLLTVAEQGREWGWTSRSSVIAYVIGALGVLAFVVIESRMGDDALIPLRLFRSRAVAVTIGASVIIGIAMFGGMMMLPLYMQIVHDASPMRSGLMMLPMVGGMMLASITSGQITARKGVVRPFPIVGTLLLTIGMVLLSRIDADTELWLVMLEMFVVGIGLGCCMQSLVLIVQNAVSPREIGVATSSATFFRQIGGTLGVAVFLSLLFSTVGDNIKDALTDEARNPAFRAALAQAAKDPQVQADPAARSLIQGIMDPVRHGAGLEEVNKDSSVLGRIPDAVAHPFQQGFATSMAQVFLVASAIAALGFLVLLALPRIELRTQSGLAARAADDAPAAQPRPDRDDHLTDDVRDDQVRDDDEVRYDEQDDSLHPHDEETTAMAQSPTGERDDLHDHRDDEPGPAARDREEPVEGAVVPAGAARHGASRFSAVAAPAVGPDGTAAVDRPEPGPGRGTVVHRADGQVVIRTEVHLGADAPDEAEVTVTYRKVGRRPGE